MCRKKSGNLRCFRRKRPSLRLGGSDVKSGMTGFLLNGRFPGVSVLDRTPRDGSPASADHGSPIDLMRSRDRTTEPLGVEHQGFFLVF